LIPDVEDGIVVAIKSSNFNKGLGPDYFDSDMLRSSKGLNERIMVEFTEAMNNMNIAEYLRVGRLVPLQKTSSKGPVGLIETDHIRSVMFQEIINNFLF
jgi:hypothetical protein